MKTKQPIKARIKARIKVTQVGELTYYTPQIKKFWGWISIAAFAHNGNIHYGVSNLLDQRKEAEEMLCVFGKLTNTLPVIQS